ncbi:DUF3024 domain-containing protein [Longivirga aurantiaca]|uniref:DUF3024 domain-containing protein n=1 Tax=Longivirga aurantiaca TaxID=1837743 RepID=A0ABW1SVI4_9ACTN
MPAEMQDQVTVECDVAPRHITLVECRPPWRGDGEWTRSPIARLRYTKSTGLWSLYWCDQHEAFHLYPYSSPTSTVADLLDEIDRDPTALFWG